jgi:hypothetical protein
MARRITGREGWQSRRRCGRVWSEEKETRSLHPADLGGKYRNDGGGCQEGRCGRSGREGFSKFGRIKAETPNRGSGQTGNVCRRIDRRRHLDKIAKMRRGTRWRIAPNGIHPHEDNEAGRPRRKSGPFPRRGFSEVPVPRRRQIGHRRRRGGGVLVPGGPFRAMGAVKGRKRADGGPRPSRGPGSSSWPFVSRPSRFHRGLR